jgi:hypothetical protein
MSHWAIVDRNSGVVKNVIVGHDDNQPLVHLLPGEIILQTSYNNRIRKNFASIGYSYNKDLDAFIPPRPSRKHMLDEETCQWFLKEELDSKKINKSNGIMRTT